MTVEYAGKSIEIRADAWDRRVYWCSHWEHIDALVDAGILERTHHGPATYGHTDYYILRQEQEAD